MTLTVFIRRAFCENGEPSSSRIVSAWLCVSSMALIWFIVRHAMVLDDLAKQQAWLGTLPPIIYALATFAASPYAIAKVTGIWSKTGAPVDPSVPQQASGS